jgi:hypothetical protein
MESQPQAFHRSHERLEIATAAISTFPRRRLRSLSPQNKTEKQNLMGRGKVEIQNPDFRFPPSRSACGTRKKDGKEAPPVTIKNS